MSSDFKPGDRVVRKDSGEFGTVSASPPPDRFWDLYVTMDNLDAELGFYEHELVLASRAAPETNSKLPYYNEHPSGVEAIDVVKHESFVRGNILKYVWRAPHKGNELQDLLKARYYLDLEIERLQTVDS